MNVLVIGSGGREHALAWKIKQSPKTEHIYVSPGNGGTSQIATNLTLDIYNHSKLKKAILDLEITLMVIGPEEPLVRGVVDNIKSDKELNHVQVVGPSASGAQLEGSKQFAKDFMNRYGIPTGKAQVFDQTNIEEGYRFLESSTPPYVLKADGLAAGKGVLITEDLEEARSNLKTLILDKKFGKASDKVLIEEFLEGIELSVFVLTDGKDYVILPEAKDYKRIGENDTGPNTGGMGAVSPVIFADSVFMKKVEERIIKPTVSGIGKEGMDYHGFIFFGLINVKGDPYVIEYNVRMGDPETEAVIPRIKNDLVEMLEACANDQLDRITMDFEPFTSTTVMTVSDGYPDSFEKGKPIQIGSIQHALVFHAGTTHTNEQLVTNGGRVITVTCLGNNMSEALSKSYQAIDQIKWEGKNYRKDIGFDLKALGQ